MSWFESQIQKRRSSDQQLLEDSFVRIAGVVLGEREAEKFNDDRIVTQNAIDEILKYYHVNYTSNNNRCNTHCTNPFFKFICFFHHFGYFW